MKRQDADHFEVSTTIVQVQSCERSLRELATRETDILDAVEKMKLRDGIREEAITKMQETIAALTQRVDSFLARGAAIAQVPISRSPRSRSSSRKGSRSTSPLPNISEDEQEEFGEDEEEGEEDDDELSDDDEVKSVTSELARVA